ncbi:MAG: UDP-diphospho-muramoylpentapeptide beta-N-acetylglucosaminyltransferase [Candidatus Desulfovibrio kirbyi]|jgi:UDP-N-acetylglucosamine--N-acetylmuramyl-(pentapeptide) pyrophosphoryl-undecaprenol N-acetylglucosamine transferase|uniref:UDP-N-acetylglucosamine--N-acetylmuramyl-(pentapeptide) pyrophosphoryl-undecaprenol N-acetylglucosamine transferase n=1 Tax=Candidatus Desulfovibrio kirbyi TaxID=2696086 RepID=A0A6L2R4N2_9BACT|nr:undecaprenyldiphospho-muramoylpentapeptide beta-N-acetylglucosaminyltransferase [Desulfovibrio sp.]GFH62483.1 MAG: UDP-diphospho-muramoylpentapeptide beta-N-acetylglucosaminyltransferase [Candidatus Desulfovibrio kirbyi]
MDKILLTGGGTGGHVFPALAVAEELRHQNAVLLFVGSRYGPEARLVKARGIAFEGLPVRGFLGRGLRSLDAAARMCFAVCRALCIVRRFKPAMVAGFGGYAAFAPMLAASLLGVPCILHEQNAAGGMSNRILARLARRVCLSMPGTEGFASDKCVVTGNPVRDAVCEIGRRPRCHTGKNLLVLGGSQGSRALNTVMPEILPVLKAANVAVRHQSGSADEQAVRAAYINAGYEGSVVVPFIEDMGEAYAWADLALCRSGASTVAELCVVALPSVLVPFPQAIHDHQTKNARLLESAGAAVFLPERELRERDLGGLIVDILENSGYRAKMSAAALGMGKPDAAARVVAALRETRAA